MPDLTHVMIDVETLGTSPGSVIFDVGAVWFDLHSGVIRDTLSLAIDPVDAQRCGLTVDVPTVLWWLDQGEVARRAAARGDRLPLSDALEALTRKLSQWVKERENLRVWCHGATFDVPMLEAAYRAVGLACPWSRKSVRDTCTLYELGGVKLGELTALSAEPHIGLNDALEQVRHAFLAYQRLGTRRTIL